MENQEKVKVAIIATLLLGVVAAILVRGQPRSAPAPAPAPRETPDEINAAPVNTERQRAPRKKKVADPIASISTTTVYPSESHATPHHADSVASNLATEQPNQAVPSTA